MSKHIKSKTCIHTCRTVKKKKPKAIHRIHYSVCNLNNRLFVCRHGETDLNRQGRIQGSLDIPLNANGIKQAQRLAKQLESQNIDIIVSSSMLRAVQTAEIISAELNLEISETMEEFREKDFGIFEGKTIEECMHISKCTDRNVSKYPTGETDYQLAERVQKGLVYLYKKYNCQKILLVCHGVVMKVIYLYLNGSNPANLDGCDFEPGNCTFIRY